MRVVQAVTVGQASRQFDAQGLEGTVKDFGDLALTLTLTRTLTRQLLALDLNP